MLVRCGACQERMTVGDDAFGQLVGCPTCGTAVRVPAAARPAAVPPVAVTPQGVQPVPVQPVPVQPVPVQPVSVQPIHPQPVQQQPVPVQPVPVQPAGITSRAVQPMSSGGALVHRCPRCRSDVEHGNALCPTCGINIKRAKRRRR